MELNISRHMIKTRTNLPKLNFNSSATQRNKASTYKFLLQRSYRQGA